MGTKHELRYWFFLISRNISQSSAVNVCSSNKSFLRSYVRRNDSFLRHALICAWLPDNNTSGTVMPRKSLGRLEYPHYTRTRDFRGYQTITHQERSCHENPLVVYNVGILIILLKMNLVAPIEYFQVHLVVSERHYQ